jgi:hypothetical protein
MTRRRAMPKAVGVDLFAFMAIMTATIGVQTLLIAIIALEIRPGGQSVQFVPSGSSGNNQGKVANYVLLQGQGRLELLADGQRQQAALGSPQVETFLDRIAKARAPQFLVIGVKPGTYAAFNQLRAQAEAKNISLGYEPIDPQWTIQPPPAAAGAVQP